MTPRRDPWLLARLFDLSFSHFVALSLVRIVYALFMVAGLAGLAFLITFLFLLNARDTTIIAVLLAAASPVIYLAYLLVLRLLCEGFIVVFTIAEDLGEIREALAERARKASPAETGAPPC
jgi:hypothetical protein